MAQEYFSGLNYSLANEDTSVEYRLLGENAENVFCIAGSGARVLPLLAKNPERLDVIDMSRCQLYLVELRREAARALTYEEWLFFLGYRGGLQSHLSVEGDSRQELFRKLSLSPECREYWEERREGWNPAGFVFLGKWERHFQMLGLMFRRYLRCDFTPIFQAQSVPEQVELWKEHWPKIRFNSFMRIAASETVFNRFLYKGHFAGADGKRTENRPPYLFLQEEFERLFTTQLARKSFFLQMLFLGRIRFEEGLPLEAHRDLYEGIRSSRTEIRYQESNLLDALARRAWDFVSLSDTISYLPDEVANSILGRWPSETRSGSKVVIRSFMRGPTKLEHPQWRALKEQELQAWETETTGVYQFHIMEKI